MSCSEGHDFGGKRSRAGRDQRKRNQSRNRSKGGWRIEFAFESFFELIESTSPSLAVSPEFKPLYDLCRIESQRGFSIDQRTKEEQADLIYSIAILHNRTKEKLTKMKARVAAIEKEVVFRSIRHRRSSTWPRSPAPETTSSICCSCSCRKCR